MKIALIAPTSIPARRANTIQVMKMAQAFTALGHELLVLVPKGDSRDLLPNWDELAHYYGLKQTFEIEWIPIENRFRRYDFGFTSIRRARNWDADLIYTRLPQAAAIASMIGIPAIFEIHDLPKGKIGPWLLDRFLKGSGARALVVITSALKISLAKRFEIQKNNQNALRIPMIVAPDGVDLQRYEKIPTPQQARQSLPSLQIPVSSFVGGYTGHLYPGRGGELILDIAEKLQDMRFLLVGGEVSDITRYNQKIKIRGLENVILAGFVPNIDLPTYQAACDILLMPYQYNVAASSGGDIAKFLSPMKMFEYMASNRVILSSDLPVLREVLNDGNAILLPPDDLTAWVAAIRELSKDSLKRTRIAAQAQKDVQMFSWKSRAQNILSRSEIENSISIM